MPSSVRIVGQTTSTSSSDRITRTLQRSQRNPHRADKVTTARAPSTCTQAHASGLTFALPQKAVLTLMSTVNLSLESESFLHVHLTPEKQVTFTFGSSNVHSGTKTTHLHFQYRPTGTFSKAGFGLLGRFFRTQSMRNCLGDFPVQLRAV